MSELHPDRHPRVLPAEAVALSFIDCVNRRDLDALADLMTDEHELQILDEMTVRGRERNRAAWRSYFESYPEYVIYPARIACEGNRVAILGSTTGSHLELPDEEERAMDVLWVATADAGRLASWAIVEDTPSTRAELGVG